ncbi:hypothetical protein Neosp_001215 [[Neocosmospora] mangrovei]
MGNPENSSTLPQTLIAYCDPEEPSSKFYLGDSTNRKMFAVTTRGGFTGDRRSIKVYSGPSTDDPLLSDVVRLDESRLSGISETENNPESRRPSPPCTWKKTRATKVSDRCYPYELKLYPGRTWGCSNPREESGLSNDRTATNEEAEPIAMVSWKRLGHKSDPFKFQFLVPERGSYEEDKWRVGALLSGLALWSKTSGSAPP